jgi:RNA polymerase sigma-70 factor, ECF subfamily
MDDSLLLVRARQLDQDALGEVYDLYSPRLFHYACRLLSDAGAAEECVAEIFCRLIQLLSTGKGPRDSLQAYLYRSAHNWITDAYRRRPSIADELPEEVADDHPGLEIQASLRLEQAQVRSALMRLTADQRQVIVLKFYENWDNEAIAESMQKPVGAVKSLQHRALDALRRILGPDEEIIYELNL